MPIENAAGWIDLIDRVARIRGSVREELKKRIQVGDPSPHAMLLWAGEGPPDHEKAVDHCEKAEKAAREGHVIEAMRELGECEKQIAKGAGGT